MRYPGRGPGRGRGGTGRGEIFGRSGGRGPTQRLDYTMVTRRRATNLEKNNQKELSTIYEISQDDTNGLIKRNVNFSEKEGYKGKSDRHKTIPGGISEEKHIISTMNDTSPGVSINIKQEMVEEVSEEYERRMQMQDMTQREGDQTNQMEVEVVNYDSEESVDFNVENEDIDEAMPQRNEPIYQTNATVEEEIYWEANNEAEKDFEELNNSTTNAVVTPERPKKNGEKEERDDVKMCHNYKDQNDGEDATGRRLVSTPNGYTFPIIEGSSLQRSALRENAVEKRQLTEDGNNVNVGHDENVSKKVKPITDGETKMGVMTEGTNGNYESERSRENSITSNTEVESENNTDEETNKSTEDVEQMGEQIPMETDDEDNKNPREITSNLSMGDAESGTIPNNNGVQLNDTNERRQSHLNESATIERPQEEKKESQTSIISNEKRISKSNVEEINPNYPSPVRGDKPLKSIVWKKPSVNTIDNYMEKTSDQEASMNAQKSDTQTGITNLNKNEVDSTSNTQADPTENKSTSQENKGTEELPQGLANRGVLQSYPKKKDTNRIKYTDEGVTKEVVYKVGICFEQSEDGQELWSTHFWQFKELHGLLARHKTYMVPIDEKDKTKEPLINLPENCNCIRAKEISAYVPVRSPWVGTRDRTKEKLLFVVKVVMPQSWNAWRFGSNVQNDFQRLTKKKGNTFHFVRVSEFDQIKIAVIIGCGPATHIGELKNAFIQEYKDRHKVSSYVPIELRNDSMYGHSSDGRIEAPVVSITVGRSIADNMIKMVRAISEESDKNLAEGKDFTIFGRKITLYLDSVNQNNDEVVPLLELQIKSFKRSKIVQYRGIRNLNQDVTLKNGEKMMLRRAILTIPTDDTTDAVPLFWQVDRQGFVDNESEKTRRPSDIVLTCDTQHHQLAKTKSASLKEELEKILDDKSIAIVFPPPPQKKVMENVFKGEIQKVNNNNIDGNLKRMQSFMSRRVSTAITTRGQTNSIARAGSRHQSAWDLRREVMKAMWTEAPPQELSSNVNRMQNTTTLSNSTDAIAAVASSTNQEGTTTTIVAARTSKVNTESNTLTMSNGVSFRQFLESLELRANATTQALEDAKKIREEDIKKNEEWKKDQEKNQEILSTTLAANVSNTEQLNTKVDQSLQQANILESKVDELSSHLSQLTQLMTQGSTAQGVPTQGVAVNPQLQKQTLSQVTMSVTDHTGISKDVPPSMSGTSQK